MSLVEVMDGSVDRVRSARHKARQMLRVLNFSSDLNQMNELML
jgi:hypothetical protein